MCQNGSEIIVGTCGRTYDMIEKNVLKLDKLRLLILDECDEMLSFGFKDQIYDIYSKITLIPKNQNNINCNQNSYEKNNDTNDNNNNEHCQIISFSATIPSEILTIGNKMMNKDSIYINLNKTKLTLNNIFQYYVSVEKEIDKFDRLLDILQCQKYQNVIIYCNTRRKVNWLMLKMKQSHWIGVCYICVYVYDTVYNILSKYLCYVIFYVCFDRCMYNSVSKIDGSMSSNERDLEMKKFQSGQTRCLISTDIMARQGRGVDSSIVSTVINYDLPNNYENYIYRTGRSCHYGRKTNSIIFITNEDIKQLKELEMYCNCKIKELTNENVL